MRRSPIFGRQTPGAKFRSPVPILAAGLLSMVAYFLLQLISSERSIRYTDEMVDAARTMQRATATTREFCDSTGIEIDETDDPNRTCLIGPELTPLMTCNARQSVYKWPVVMWESFDMMIVAIGMIFYFR